MAFSPLSLIADRQRRIRRGRGSVYCIDTHAPVVWGGELLLGMAKAGALLTVGMIAATHAWTWQAAGHIFVGAGAAVLIAAGGVTTVLKAWEAVDKVRAGIILNRETREHERKAREAEIEKQRTDAIRMDVRADMRANQEMQHAEARKELDAFLDTGAKTLALFKSQTDGDVQRVSDEVVSVRNEVGLLRTDVQNLGRHVESCAGLVQGLTEGMRLRQGGE